MVVPEASSAAAEGPPAGRPPRLAEPHTASRWERACRSLLLFLLPFLCYLALAAGSGAILGHWSWPEILAAAIVGLLCAVGSLRLTGRPFSPAWCNPLRWTAGMIYLAGPFFYALVKANLQVCRLVVTGRIRPAIVRIEPGIESSLGLYLLANSITLSPGTLTLMVDEADGAIYVHCLAWHPSPDRETANRAVAGALLPWIRRLARKGTPQ